jgi:hypothetical protein
MSAIGLEQERAVDMNSYRNCLEKRKKGVEDTKKELESIEDKLRDTKERYNNERESAKIALRHGNIVVVESCVFNILDYHLKIYGLEERRDNLQTLIEEYSTGKCCPMYPTEKTAVDDLFDGCEGIRASMLRIIEGEIREEVAKEKENKGG